MGLADAVIACEKILGQADGRVHVVGDVQGHDVAIKSVMEASAVDPGFQGRVDIGNPSQAKL